VQTARTVAIRHQCLAMAEATKHILFNDFAQISDTRRAAE
jgi:hypothetical protein